MMTRRRKAAVVFICAGIAVAMCSLTMYSHLRPVAATIAEGRAYVLAESVVNAALNEQLDTLGIRYDELVTLERDDSGRIVALHTNAIRINAVRAQMVERVLSRLDGIPVSPIAVPLGSLVGGELLSGRGPGIVLNAIPVGTASATYRNIFTSAGINQTRHQIVITVEVGVTLLLSSSLSVTATAKGEVTVAETIIVGVVPGVYGQLTIEN